MELLITFISEELSYFPCYFLLCSYILGFSKLHMCDSLMSIKMLNEKNVSEFSNKSVNILSEG